MALYGLSAGYSLKDLLENPILQNPPQLRQDGNVKQEKGKGGMSPVFDPTSAFLRPNLWDTSEYTSEADVSLEYMDLDEFLSENGIPVDFSENSNGSNISTELTSLQIPSPKSVGSPVSLSVTETPSSPTEVTTSICTSPEPDEEDAKKEVTHGSPLNINVDFNVSEQEVALATVPESEQNKERNSPELSIEFEVGEGEQSLVNVPGEETFDPKSRKFSEDELKPQPMIKKSRKVFVPDEQKDDKYWSRRKKNNVAAKRSRDARRVKENQIAMRACFLEKCNHTLTDEVQKLKKENSQLKKSLEECEKKLKQLA